MARYFIAEPTPLRMRPGLFKLGRDFGNGQADELFFQKDAAHDVYLEQKRLILSRHPERLAWVAEPETEQRLNAVGRWMLEQGARELGGLAPGLPQAFQAGEASRRAWYDLSCAVQEDFAVVDLQSDGTDRLALLSVCFPSGWQPERLLGKSFHHVHAPVVEFDEVAQKSEQLVRAMVERGPYVRFVWTVTADGRLDHHPLQAPRDPWTKECRGYLRVERQVTVPFAALRMSLFLIRTYLYPFSELSSAERSTLLSAVQQLSPAILAYKGLSDGLPWVMEKLANE